MQSNPLQLQLQVEICGRSQPISADSIKFTFLRRPLSHHARASACPVRPSRLLALLTRRQVIQSLQLRFPRRLHWRIKVYIYTGTLDPVPIAAADVCLFKHDSQSGASMITIAK